VHVELTETQRHLRETIRGFARTRVAPAAAETDRAARFPRELVAALGDLGVMGSIVPEVHGGAGVDAVAWTLAVEELATACASTALVFAAHTALATGPLLQHATAAQQLRWLPRLASGDVLGCLADGGDVAARRAGDGWALGGTVRSVANGAEAGVALVVAGDRAFVVETASRGWTAVRRDDRTGLRGAAPADVTLHDVGVPGDALLGDGGAIAAAARDAWRIALAALGVGIARAAVDASLSYSRERRVFGEPIAAFQGAQWRLADMATAVESARLLTLRAAFLKDRGLPYTSEAAMAKVFAAETAMTLATQAVQMHGGYGYTREFPVERHFRDAAALATLGGPPAAERLAIADHLLGEARA
jgi:alkylation response protein AidB-like acyl-CoA dehydrogenase